MQRVQPTASSNTCAPWQGANHRADGVDINLIGAAVGNGVGGGPTARGDRIRTKFYRDKGMISQARVLPFLSVCVCRHQHY
jgi:hypothetical protein